MKIDFWHDRWQQDQTGFHQDEINPYLQSFWNNFNLARGSKVFVPLCGKSLDMLWLKQQGYQVVGNEVSPLAVEAFFRENSIEPEVKENPAFQCWSGKDIEILCGDFFDLTASDLAGISAVYDRASLIALPPAMRRQYAEHLCHIVPSEINILLVTLEYSQQQMDGPPFSVSHDELCELYQGKYSISQLASSDIIGQEPHFKSKGLNHLMENIYRLSDL
ncbi:MAG: thiopurine S-methyltransferase [Gammaproteobacteria bacterium]|nr:thiopurine S-methyltransferase [Gammaproteobacteria bacterium]